MQAWRTLSRRPTLASINARYKKTVGHRFRDVIENVGQVIHPVVKHVFPSFIAFHYFYIISMTFLGSILMYPVRNYAYIDILFTAAGASTQGGLNTINTNEMTLYQQIVIYVICCLTTPIWIHGGLAFVRLYWFERYFDGIKDWSKKNFKMRRTKTLLQREITRTATESQRRPTSRSGNQNSGKNADFQSKLFSGQMVNREEDASLKENYEMENLHDNDDGGSSLHGKDRHTSSSTGSTKSVDQDDDTPGIKFGAMPKPQKNPSDRNQVPIEHFIGRRRSEDISPADMFRSIAMLRNQHVIEEKEEDGPALVINGPAERKPDSNAGLSSPARNERKPDLNAGLARNERVSHTSNELPSADGQVSNNSLEYSGLTSSSSSQAEVSLPVQWTPEQDRHEIAPSSIKFNEPEQPSPNKRLKLTSSKAALKKLRPNSIAKLTRSGRLKDRVRKIRNISTEDGNDADKEQASGESDEESHENLPDACASTSEVIQKTGSFPLLEKVQSNLAIPSKDATGGSKFYKRCNTIETSGNRHMDTLTKSPSFQNMIYEKWKEDRRRKGRFSRPVKRNSVLSRSTSDFGNDYDTNRKPRASLDGTSNDEETIGDYGGMTFSEPTERPPRLKRMSTNYLSWQPKIGRNSTFVGLSDMQRAELGGVEYRAIKLLCKLVLIYYIGFHILGFVMLLPWITHMDDYINLVRSDGVSPAWWGFFTSMSAFNDLGLTLTPDSMSSFNKAVYPLITMMWFIIIGNTGFPVFLRFIIWVFFKLSRDLSLVKESLGFLLDHPRRCFTLLFPSAPTWWLMLILVALNAIDLILFIVLDLNSQVVEGLSSGYKVLDGLFQAVSTRTAGFSVLNLSMLHPSIQVSYMLMMYVSVLPLAISIRRTNVYEEQSLGIYQGRGSANENQGEDEDTPPRDENEIAKKLDKSTRSFIGTHVRRQLSFDLWFLFLGLFIICISEGGKIQNPAMPEFTVFPVLFEIVSAYGTVGLSLGYPSTDQSFSAQFNTFSKVIMIAMLVRGRHRGLPYSLDRAIILPSQSLERRDHIEDMKSERNSEGKDPIVAYLRKQSTSAKGQLRSMLHRPHSNQTTEEHAPLRSSLDYHSTPRSSARSYNEISPMSRSPLGSSHNLPSDPSSSENEEDGSRLSEEAPDAQETPRTFSN
ncbi:LANO_0G05358g1_1 [Lachancea nothofagi CBS 11611]|uniref:Potassium transport protein n=1 Tax=Lachancea nothofagi CBS 11611 TaxID=1266666 RepID=A0A1G4KGG6_9SACH|nr:LANO_0G05358g1_1 [Lachancea nothofagi CBS 11611]